MIASVSKRPQRLTLRSGEMKEPDLFRRMYADNMKSVLQKIGLTGVRRNHGLHPKTSVLCKNLFKRTFCRYPDGHAFDVDPPERAEHEFRCAANWYIRDCDVMAVMVVISGKLFDLSDYSEIKRYTYFPVSDIRQLERIFLDATANATKLSRSLRNEYGQPIYYQRVAINISIVMRLQIGTNDFYYKTFQAGFRNMCQVLGIKKYGKYGYLVKLTKPKWSNSRAGTSDEYTLEVAAND